VGTTVKQNFEPHGIIPAIVTPLDDSGRFHFGAFERLVKQLYEARVDGLYVCGQTGEGLQQALGQRQEVAEAAVHLSPPGKSVIIHVGAPSTEEAIALACHASKIGAHAISSLPPFGNYSFEEIRSFYQALASASGVPLLIYYFPSLAPAIRTIDQILELCRIPNVAGLKFTDSDLFRLWAIRQTGALVFNGSDEMLAAGLLMGANGGIGSIYNVIPEHFVTLYEHAVAGRWEDARTEQGHINKFIQVILQFPVNPAVKAILKWSGIDCGACILPRRPLSSAEERQLRRQLEQTDLGRELFGVEAAIR
jgi:N-acetylneuraminate lyase